MLARHARPGPVPLLAILLLVGSSGASAAEISAKRKPRNALEDIGRVGNRDVTGILNILSMRQEIQLGRMRAERINCRVKIIGILSLRSM